MTPNSMRRAKEKKRQCSSGRTHTKQHVLAQFPDESRPLHVITTHHHHHRKKRAKASVGEVWQLRWPTHGSGLERGGP